MEILKLHIDLQVKAYIDFMNHFKHDKGNTVQTFSDFIALAIVNEWLFNDNGEWENNY